MAEAFLQHHKPNALRIALEQNTPKSFLCYVDDSHARFNTSDAPTKFQDILNEQHPSIIKYTTETEDVDKRLQFLDIDIHNNDGVYKYKIHRKNAIKNLQIKPHSGHDLKVLRGIFSGFLHWAYTICEGQHWEEEVDFFVHCFSENSYNHAKLLDIARQFK